MFTQRANRSVSNGASNTSVCRRRRKIVGTSVLFDGTLTVRTRLSCQCNHAPSVLLLASGLDVTALHIRTSMLDDASTHIRRAQADCSSPSHPTLSCSHRSRECGWGSRTWRRTRSRNGRSEWCRCRRIDPCPLRSPCRSACFGT